MKYYIYIKNSYDNEFSFIGINYELAFDLDHLEKFNAYYKDYKDDTIWVDNFKDPNVLTVSLDEAKRLVNKYNDFHPNDYYFISEDELMVREIIE